MDKTQLKRHDYVFLTQQGRKNVLRRVTQEISNKEALTAAEQILTGVTEIPGIVRRNELLIQNAIAVGFVYHQRFSGNRIRIGSYIHADEIKYITSVYDVIKYRNSQRTACMQTVEKIKQLALKYELAIGVLGSAGMELVTGMPYTDECSDIDILLKPSTYSILCEFYKQARSINPQINMDFELDLPNGYGVKLAEVFMDTGTVLGKSIKDVTLLSKKELMNLLTKEK